MASAPGGVSARRIEALSWLIVLPLEILRKIKLRLAILTFSLFAASLAEPTFLGQTPALIVSVEWAPLVTA